MLISTTVDDRKKLVKAISDYTGEKAKYLGAPTFNYQIGIYTVDREGNILIDENISLEIEPGLKEILIAKGFIESGMDILEINVPTEGLNGLALKNLAFMLHSKQYLLNKVTGAKTFEISEELTQKLNEVEDLSKEDFLRMFQESGGKESNLGIEFTNSEVTFSVPRDDDPEKNRAYIELAAKMVARASEAVRINPKELRPENEKYYLRVWLLQLGFKGQWGKASRKALLKGLRGHTAFRTPEEEERAKERLKAKKERISHE